MCGIVGFFDKTSAEEAPIGMTIFRMLEALGCRGPDSAGVALYANQQQQDGDLVLRIKLGEGGDYSERVKEIADRVQKAGGVLGEIGVNGDYLRLVISADSMNPKQLEKLIESTDKEIEVVSMGNTLEIIKQVGSPMQLDTTYHVREMVGTHGIGHTRLSTESVVDLSHSQPFWAHGHPDLATVHNGHITNYDKMRRQYEQRGVRFYTHNDSEIIGIYLAEQLDKGLTLEEAMHASMRDFDGSFCYLVATDDEFGYAKDPFALKPLLVSETEEFVLIATEEIAIHAAMAGGSTKEAGSTKENSEVAYKVREAGAKEVRVWKRA